MLYILSSAKSLDFSHHFTSMSTEPCFTQETKAILNYCKKLNAMDLEKLMDISSTLADLNYQRFQNFENQPEKPAIFAYNGDVYKYIDVKNFNQEQMLFLQMHIGIISGLYGILRPLDLIQPYRLEMSTKLSITSVCNDLYKFWQDKLTEYINAQLMTYHDNKLLINLASKEYLAAINIRKLSYPMINIHFKEKRDNTLKVIALNAKKARGMMVNFIVTHNIDDANSLKQFNEQNYRFDKNLSTDNDMVFVR